MSNFEVIFYRKDSGEEPAKEFIMTLDDKMRAKVNSIISLLEENGTKLRKPYQE